jgi:ABC-type antimicrobial peptide transport system permease subunit
MNFLLVLRNIARNKKNNSIIALLFAVITFIFFTGNTVIGMSDISLRQAFVESVTGDVVLEKKNDVSMNLFGANVPVIDSFFTIPVLPAYDLVFDIAGAEPGIEKITSQVSGSAYMDLLGVREAALLCGVDAGSYFSLFPSIVLERGRFLQPGELGAMITMERAQRIAEKTGRFPETGDPLLFTTGGTLGFKIREAPLVGIFSYKNPGMFMNEIIIVDPQTVRVLNSIQVASSGNVELDPNASSLLALDIDDIFSQEFSSGEEFSSNEEFSEDFLQSFLTKDTGVREEETGGDWNFIIIRLKKGVSPAAFISNINKKLGSYGITAVNWRTAAGTSAILLLLIQSLFNFGILLVCVTGIITAINIMLISVFRRTREIGTLRAIGASDLYIRSLILQENFALAVIAGFVGILGGFVFIRFINSLNVKIPNELVSSLLGGGVLTLEFLPPVAWLSFTLAVALGLVASIYPMEATVRILPMEAIRHG